MFKSFFVFLSFCLFTLSSINANLPQDHFTLLLSPQEIQKKIEEVAQKLNEQYKDKELVIVMIMKGSFVLVSDLIRSSLDFPVQVLPITCKSYHGTQRGELQISGIDATSLQDKHVLVVDDIYDSGKTLNSVVNFLKEQHPASLKTLVLLNKSATRAEKNYPEPDFFCFSIPDLFVIGYGLDYDEYYRGLPGVYVYHE